MTTKMLTIEDIEPEGKTIFARVDLNTPLDPKTGKLMELNRIAEASVTIRDLKNSKVVVASHQGRVGRDDFISLEQHAEALSKYLGYKVKFVDDIFGPTAREQIDSLSDGEVLLLDNLRLAAEENNEFTPADAAKTILVQRLYKHFDACVLDAFPTAHRSCPSIVGFAELLPACGGRLVAKELKALNRILTIAKGLYTTVLGGAKISDRLEAIDTLIENKRADKVLLTGLVANIFLQASGRISDPLGLQGEDRYVRKAEKLLSDYPDIFEMPVDVAVETNGSRLEVAVEDLEPGQKIMDIGSATIDHYSRLIRSSGTVFMSGPPGIFENSAFTKGTEELLRAMASSLGTTIVSGGHLSAALERFGIKGWIDYVSTAGGALVLFLAGKNLPLFEALDKAAGRMKK
ncbi:MAG: phosphoglycerate kinase [Nitrososphaerales archaeon]